MRPVSPATAVVLAGLTLATAAGLYLALIHGVGFPDGHLTAYERWALPLRKAAALALVALALGVLGLAPDRSGSPTRARLLRAALVAAIALTLATLALLPAIGLHALGLDHGQGG